MTEVYTVKEVKEVVDWLGRLYHYPWDEDNQMFTDGEIEYQIRDYTNGHFSSILVRFCEDTTHSYREFFEYNYDDLSSLIEDAFSEETLDSISDKIEQKLAARRAEKAAKSKSV